MWFVHDGRKKTRSSREPQQSSEPQICFARVAMAHACTTVLYLLHLHAASLDTVSCGTLAYLACYCCCAVAVPVLILLNTGTLSPAVITWGCHNDNEALPQGVWYTPYPG